MASFIEPLLESARAEAQRRGHREIDLRHLLLALLARAEVVRAVSRRGVSVACLSDSLQKELAAVPGVAGYRDGMHAIANAAVVTRLVARHSGWRSLVRGGSMNGLIEEVFTLDDVAERLESARFDESPVTDLHARATVTMARMRHTNLLVEHAIITLIDEARFAKALRVLSLEPEAFRAAMTELVQSSYVSAWLAASEKLVALAVLKANLARRRTLTTEFVAVDLLRHERVKKSLAAVQVDPYDLLFAFVHGLAPASAPAPSTRECRVVFYDDDFSTMETVVDVLTKAFGVDQEDARKLMLDVHEQGSAEIARVEAKDATRLLAESRAICRAAEAPLRIELEPA